MDMMDMMNWKVYHNSAQITQWRLIMLIISVHK